MGVDERKVNLDKHVQYVVIVIVIFNGKKKKKTGADQVVLYQQCSRIPISPLPGAGEMWLG